VLKGKGAEKAEQIENKIARSVIRKAKVFVENLSSTAQFTRASEIELSQERRKARAEREMKKSKK